MTSDSREYPELLLEELPQACFSLAADFTIVHANGAAHHSLGYGDFSGLKLSRLLSVLDAEAVDRRFERFAGSEISVLRVGSDEEARAMRKDGSSYPVRVSIVRTKSVTISYTAILFDLSRDRDLELRAIEEEKKQQIAIRHEALGNLAGKFAHDMNNILAVIGGFGELLSMAPRDEDIEAIFEINHAVKRAANLTTRILAYTGRQQIDRRVEDMKVLISERSSLWQSMLGEKINLKLELSEDGITALIDDKLIVQVMLNLLSNCREALQDSGNVRISVGVVLADAAYFQKRGVDAPAGKFAEIRVRDDGPGISAESMPMVFEPHYSTKDPNKSSGLGLAIARGIVKQHEGFIFCDSAPGEGTTMQILLPLTNQEVTQQTGLEISAKIHPPDFKVLIAEDEDQIRRILESSLCDAGFQIVTAANGRIALDWLEACNGNIDLLISDVMMPEVSGIALAQRALELYPRLPVIFMTGYSSQVLDSHPVLRAIPVIHKPFSPRALVAAAVLEITKAVSSRGVVP